MFVTSERTDQFTHQSDFSRQKRDMVHKGFLNTITHPTRSKESTSEKKNLHSKI